MIALSKRDSADAGGKILWGSGNADPRGSSCAMPILNWNFLEAIFECLPLAALTSRA